MILNSKCRFFFRAPGRTGPVTAVHYSHSSGTGVTPALAPTSSFTFSVCPQPAVYQHSPALVRWRCHARTEKKKKKNTQPLDCAHEKTRGGRIPCHGRDPAHLHSHDELPRTGHGVHYAKLPCTLPGIPHCFVLREPSCGGLKYGAREHIKQFIRIKARPGQVPLAVVCLGEEPPTLRYLPRPRPGTRLANRIDALNVEKGPWQNVENAERTHAKTCCATVHQQEYASCVLQPQPQQFDQRRCVCVCMCTRQGNKSRNEVRKYENVCLPALLHVSQRPGFPCPKPGCVSQGRVSTRSPSEFMLPSCTYSYTE